MNAPYSSNGLSGAELDAGATPVAAATAAFRSGAAAATTTVAIAVTTATAVAFSNCPAC